jgi:hypothetical protein
LVAVSEELRGHERLGNTQVGMRRPRAVQFLKAKLYEFAPYSGYKLAVPFGILSPP